MERLYKVSDNGFMEFYNRELGFSLPRTFSRHISTSESLVKRIDLYEKLRGHEGCVNTIEFNTLGDHLVSGSDDRQIMFWEWASKTLKFSYPSGHLDNVFQARIMPFTDDRKIVTSSADGKVRLGEVLENSRVETRQLGKHQGRVHKLAVEPGSPYILYSCAEDGLVQRYDLRSNSATKLFYCSAFTENRQSSPSIRLNAIVIDPRNPHHFAVAGSDEYARVYDIRRYQLDCSSKVDSPVNTFCPSHLIETHEVHITALAYSSTSELLVSYNDELIYLFQKNMGLGPSPLSVTSDDLQNLESAQVYSGHRNSETVKGVNFFGPNDEYVMSGSDCGHIFIWKKKGAKLVRLMVGDRNIVNQLEAHPCMPVIATCGIEKNVKIWSPTSSDINPLPENVDEIMELNRRGREDHSRVLLTPDIVMHVLRLHRRQALAYIERRPNREDVESDEDDGRESYVLGFSDGDSDEEYSTIREDLVKDNCSSSKDTSNKENIGVNKSEGAKLNMEPVQMKKKRKGGGYNLRKSLAWDRAFLTEEGVLDPLELSMISGTNVNSSREGLSTINEDDSLSNDYVSHSDSPDLQALEKNLFKEAHAVSAKKDRGSVHLPPEHNSPARSHRASTSVASPRVLPSRGANKTGSRTGGCPRPLPLSSLKRPANTNASQTATKESKFPRIPVSKPGRSSSIVSKKSVTQEATHVKQTQIQQPVVSLQNQRNVALKSSPKSVKNNKDRPKPSSGSLSVKSLVSHSKRTAVKSPIYPNSSAQLNPSLGSKVTNTNAKVIPAGVSPSIAVPLSECQDITTKLPSSLPCGTSITSRTLQHKQLPSLKPSGLRMPSPSLGFFGQPKNSFSHTASRRAKEADIPGLRKPGYLRPPNSPVEIAKVVTDMKQNVDTVVLGSRSDFQSFSHEGMKQNVGEDAEEESLKILNEDELSEPLNDRNILSGNIGSSGLGCRESERPTDVNWENWEPCPQQSSMNCDKCLSRAGNSMENSSVEHSDVLESSSGEAIIEVPCGNEYLSGGKGSGSKDSQNLSNENLETADFVTPASREIELKCLEPSSRENCTNLEKSLILEDANPQSHNVETEAQMTNIISTSECKNNVNRHSEVGDLNSSSSKSLELQSPYIAPNSQNKHGLAAADILLVEEGSEQYILEVTKKLPVTELDAACKSELDSSGEISQVSVRAQDEHSEVRKMLGEVLVKDSSKTFFGIASSVENHNCSVTRYLVSDINCSGEITSLSHSALNEGSKSLVTYECGTFDGKDVQNRQANENDLMVEEPENITLLIPPASEIADLSCGSSLTESKFDVEDQNTDHQNIPEPNSNFHDFPEMPLEKSNISPTATARQIEELGREVTSSSSILQVEDEAVQEPDCSVPLEYCINLVHEASDQFTPIVPGKRSGEAGFPNFCVLVEKVPEVNGSLPTANCLSRETTLLSELEENTILESGVGEVPKTIDARGGELESSRPHSSMPLLMHFSDDLGDESNGSSYIVHTTSSCVEVEPSPESYDPFAGSEMKHDSEHGGFLVQDLTSSRYGNQADSRLKKNPLLGERKIQFASDTENLAEGSDSELDAALCVVENKDTTASIKNSGSSSSGNSVVIIPPRNAVPFSDEWLAAMEAAGEDILKMKSGAVQNSPTDKSLPEPSPWSPVRRKNNAIGPFDCTKFTNNIPSDSQ